MQGLVVFTLTGACCGVFITLMECLTRWSGRGQGFIHIQREEWVATLRLRLRSDDLE